MQEPLNVYSSTQPFYHDRWVEDMMDSAWTSLCRTPMPQCKLRPYSIQLMVNSDGEFVLQVHEFKCDEDLDQHLTYVGRDRVLDYVYTQG